ncbi:MAG: hypothetical protein HY270_00895 [Deltaproteobacteria bacterium]|nr:hypothetical protein [Deltaproteobacteria bacterium]
MLFASVPLMVLAGCGTTNISYKPMAAANVATKVSVGLRIVDERPADKGGTQKNFIGQVRSSYGIPRALKDANVVVATSTVGAMTVDALQQAGLGVGRGSGKRTLVATIKHFWMDDVQGYKATVTVQYELQNASFKIVWSKQLSGVAGGASSFTSPEKTAQELFGQALADLSSKAAAEFKSSEFQAALG